MGFFDKLSDMLNEEKSKASRDSKSNKRGRSKQDDVCENFLKTLENATGSSRDKFDIKDIK